MNSRKIKFKIARSCKGNLTKYFEKVEIVNLLLLKNVGLTSEIDVLKKVNSIYSKRSFVKKSQC